MTFRISDYDTRKRLELGALRQKGQAGVEILTKAEAVARKGWVEPQQEGSSGFRSARYIRLIARPPYWTSGFSDGMIVDEVEVFEAGGETNIAAGKTVIAGNGCIGDYAKVTDGQFHPDNATSGVGAFFVEPAAGKFFTIDLGQAYNVRTIDAYVVTPEPNHDFDIWGSADNVTYFHMGFVDAQAVVHGVGNRPYSLLVGDDKGYLETKLTGPDARVLYSSDYTGGDGPTEPWQAFNQTSGGIDGWGSRPGPQMGNEWIGFNYQTPKKLRGYSFQLQNHASGWSTNGPRAWRIQGSNDGVTWTTVDTQTGQEVHLSGLGPARWMPRYDVANSPEFEQWRLLVDAYGGGYHIAISEMAFYTA